MIDPALGPDVIAFHEAGHVVVGLHLGLQLVGVDLVPRDGYAAVTIFEVGELQRLDGSELAVIAYSGIAGQHVAGVGWSTCNSESDFRKFGAASKPGCLDQAWAILRAAPERFQLVASRIRSVLDEEQRLVPIEELLRS